jgi:predicted AlkP superfamily phosphohydrolase/phosphomutase
LCQAIFNGRERALLHQIQNFREGVLGVVFDDLDRIQHMFRRDRPDIVEQWYIKLDELVGRIVAKLGSLDGGKVRLLVLSDHGFEDFTYKVHLNRWLAENGYLAAPAANGAGSLADIDWPHTQAYAVGLNSLYLNLEGREGKGSVRPDQAAEILSRMKAQLLEWKGPDREPVISRVLERSEAFSGPLASYGPDLLIGFTPGYRASSETGLGKWMAQSVEANHDHWGADHCVDSISVPGVIFASGGLGGNPHPSFRDIPRYTLGKDIQQDQSPPPPPSTTGGEDQEILEERLKGLGYL